MGRPKIDKSDWVCCVCGEKYGERTERFQKIDGKVYCAKHASQIKKHGKVLPGKKERNRVGNCCICGEKGCGTFKDGKDYCKRHYLQMYRHGKIFDRTIYDRNEYIDHPESGYCECVMYDKNFDPVGTTLVDIEQKERLKDYKIYMRIQSNKKYAIINLGEGQKLLLHRFLCGITDRDYTVDRCVDHINGNSLDNRIKNLRICSQSENMKNIKKDNKICGVKWLIENQKWTATITNNYKTEHLGNFIRFEEAVYARLKREKELYGEYGANKKYYYILEIDNPLEEIEKIGFINPEKKDRIVPLLGKTHNRVSNIGKEILDEIKDKENNKNA